MKERFLLLENDEKDALLNLEYLKKEFDFDFLVTQNKQDFLQALESFNPTIILSDYNLDQYTGLQALKDVRKRDLKVPFILVTGSIEEENAVKCLKEGAWNYVMKDNLLRLNPIVKQTLELKNEFAEKEKLNESFRSIFENSLDVILLLDMEEGKILEVNNTIKRVLGYKKQDLIDKKFSILFAKDVKLPREKMIKKIKAYNSIFDMQKFRRSDGTTCPMELTANIINWNHREVIYVTLRDVSERMELQEVINSAEQSFQNIFDSAIDAIYMQDENQIFIKVNEGAVRMYGYTKEELVGNSPAFVSAPGKNDLKKVQQYFQEALRGNPQQFEFWGKRKNGEIFPKIVRLVKGSYQNKVVVYAFALDMTEQYQAMQKLNERNEMYRSIIENSHDGILLTDDNYHITFVNDQLCEIVNYTKDELLDTDFRLYIADHHKKMVKERYLRRQKGEKVPSNYEIDLTDKQGNTKHIEITASVLKLNDRTITLAEILDVTEKKEYEKQRQKAVQELQEREEFNYALFEYNPIETLIVDKKGRIVKTNRILRESRSRLPILESIMYKDYAGKHKINMYEKMITCINTKKTITVEEAPYKNKILNITIAPFPKGAIITSRDITAKITAENQIKKMNSVFEQLSSDPETNIDFIIQKTNEILKGKFTYYLRKENEDSVVVFGASDKKITGNQPGKKFQGNICNEVFKQTKGNPVIFNNLKDTKYSKTDRIVKKFKIKSYIGFPIQLQNKVIGALCLADSEEREFTPSEVYIISTLAKAISIEEERNFTLKKVQTAYQERGILLKEIHHRVNNNLQILISLLRMQKNFTDDKLAKSILNDSIFRVRTMSMVHEKLYQNKNLMEISFEDYLLSLISNIYIKTKVSSEKVKIEYDVNDIKMDINIAIPCGLILYELISNSMLHAFPENTKGKINIKIEKRKRIFNLSIKDNGIGLDEKIDFEQNNSIGFYLTNMMLSQIDGQCEINRKKGTSYLIRFPE